MYLRSRADRLSTSAKRKNVGVALGQVDGGGSLAGEHIERALPGADGEQQPDRSSAQVKRRGDATGKLVGDESPQARDSVTRQLRTNSQGSVQLSWKLLGSGEPQQP